MFFSVVILAVSLSLDALVVGMVYGIRRVKIPLISKLIICFFSILYSGIALIIGKSLSAILPSYLSKIVGVVILVTMGVWIIIHTLLNGEDEKIPAGRTDNKNKTLIKIAIKSLGITIQVIKNPVEGDIDKSGSIDTPESILLGLALSVDAIGAGIGSALAGFSSVIIPFSVGLFQLSFLYAGTGFGKKLTVLQKLDKKVLSLLPGILFIFLAILRVY